MHAEHGNLRNALLSLAGSGSVAHQGSGSYTGSPHKLLGVAVPELRRLGKSWVKANGKLPPEEILAVGDSLFAGELYDEKMLGAIIAGYSKPARRVATPSRVECWLNALVGWAEIDALCANVFQAEEILADWSSWGTWLRALAASPNINKRRASLVLLTGPVRRDGDPRLADAAFANVAALESERAILITKAVSWLLRSLISRRRDEVARYLDAHRASLPAIAVREVSSKLDTGLKTRRAPG